MRVLKSGELMNFSRRILCVLLMAALIALLPAKDFIVLIDLDGGLMSSSGIMLGSDLILNSFISGNLFMTLSRCLIFLSRVIDSYSEADKVIGSPVYIFSGNMKCFMSRIDRSSIVIR